MAKKFKRLLVEEKTANSIIKYAEKRSKKEGRKVSPSQVITETWNKL